MYRTVNFFIFLNKQIFIREILKIWLDYKYYNQHY